jgi:predicted membrane protein
MKNLKRIIFGIMLVAAGTIFALNTLKITDIDIFFKGWWTLFIIIPCFVNLVSGHDISGNIAGVALGVLLLLCTRDILDWSMMWKLFIPAVIIIAGLKMLFSGIFGKKKKNRKIKKRNGAIFGGCNMKCDGEVFEGAELSTLFGGVNCDVSNAIIEKDCTINAYTCFGGISIRVPASVHVETSSACTFGAVIDNTQKNNENVPDGAPTIYINASVNFGGIKISNGIDDDDEDEDWDEDWDEED